MSKKNLQARVWKCSCGFQGIDSPGSPRTKICPEKEPNDGLKHKISEVNSFSIIPHIPGETLDEYMKRG